MCSSLLCVVSLIVPFQCAEIVPLDLSAYDSFGDRKWKTCFKNAEERRSQRLVFLVGVCAVVRCTKTLPNNFFLRVCRVSAVKLLPPGRILKRRAVG